jgi:hypothetical protein
MLLPFWNDASCDAEAWRLISGALFHQNHLNVSVFPLVPLGMVHGIPEDIQADVSAERFFPGK